MGRTRTLADVQRWRLDAFETLPSFLRSLRRHGLCDMASRLPGAVFQMPVDLLRKLRTRKSGPRYAVPDGICVYAIGDVHGCLDQLNRILDAIDRDAGSRTAQSRLILLGDLVDRGPQSAQVIDRVLSGDLPTGYCDFIMGNHEEVMLDCFHGSVESYHPWLQFGGAETLASYGIDRRVSSSDSFDLAAEMRKAIPTAHIEFLMSFKDYIRVGDYLFVHAGIRPGVALDQQSGRDFHWIRRDFLDATTDHGYVVVHGHTIVPRIEFHPNRIALDTGCFLTGQLGAVAIESDTARVITAKV